MAVRLLVGTTKGLWEIGAFATRRWFRGHQHRHVLANQAIAALTRLTDDGVMAATATGKLWQRTPGQNWRRYPLGTASDADELAGMLTTALASGGDARLWRGTMPVSLWHTAPGSHVEHSWQRCAALTTLAEAGQWWGPSDPIAPLVTAIAPDPRDAQVATIAIAVGGVYHTADGGKTWQGQQRGIAPLTRHGAHDCDAHRHVLGLARHPNFPDLLYATSASALYRADTTTAIWRWEDITPPHASALLELPGHVTPAPHERDTAFAVLPLAADETRCTLWQTRDGGAIWHEFAAAPVLPNPTLDMTGAAPATIAIAVSHVTPERMALVTPAGEVYLTDMGAGTQWRHVATGLGHVTCACWAEQ